MSNSLMLSKQERSIVSVETYIKKVYYSPLYN